MLLCSPVEEATVKQVYFGVATRLFSWGQSKEVQTARVKATVDKWMALSLDLEPDVLPECQSF